MNTSFNELNSSNCPPPRLVSTIAELYTRINELITNVHTFLQSPTNTNTNKKSSDYLCDVEDIETQLTKFGIDESSLPKKYHNFLSLSTLLRYKLQNAGFSKQRIKRRNRTKKQNPPRSYGRTRKQ
jgi:hypothetical protein